MSAGCCPYYCLPKRFAVHMFEDRDAYKCNLVETTGPKLTGRAMSKTLLYSCATVHMWLSIRERANVCVLHIRDVRNCAKVFQTR
jgi:hypothetical protein